ncbi:hypothetical protein OOJ91_20380 [Micromonospora lupini]|uniref:hypothetical protein n=1 Tax=Micromonospora lupini TaxID=285679 RepID=UPI0022529BD9|nr:hypothetical protein [Micromonospora lupini]MCX5068201.1 hypothetical protein [Micromonospora lupini]
MLLATLSGCFRSGPAGSEVPQNSDPSPAVVGTVASATPPEALGRDDEDDDEGPAAPVAEAAPAAAAFATAWARPGLDAARWLEGVAPLCVPRFAERMRTVDPANLPASRITGRPRATYPVRDGGGQFAISTDRGTLLVSVADIKGRWLVTGNDFKRAGQ